jgi:hypothetical protein
VAGHRFTHQILGSKRLLDAAARSDRLRSAARDAAHHHLNRLRQHRTAA